MSINWLTDLFFKSVVAASALALLSACAEPTAYAPAGADGRGFKTQQVEQGRFMVSFRGNSLTERETVETYLLYRAAEVARDSGGSWFRITDQDTETVTRFSGTSLGFGGSHVGRLGYRHFGRLRTEFVSVRPTRSYEAFAQVQVFRGRKPANDPDAYSVQSVMQTLAPRILRPPTEAE
ncbi:MAG: hypothetical protein AAF732_22035 [Pseudomonadota bacterium]